MDHYTAIRWLVYWSLTDGLLHLVQRAGAWAGSDCIPNVTAHPSTASVCQLHIIRRGTITAFALQKFNFSDQNFSSAYIEFFCHRLVTKTLLKYRANNVFDRLTWYNASSRITMSLSSPQCSICKSDFRAPDVSATFTPVEMHKAH